MACHAIRAATTRAPTTGAARSTGADLHFDRVVAAGGQDQLVSGGGAGPSPGSGADGHLPSLAAFALRLHLRVPTHPDPDLWRLLHVRADPARELGQGGFRL